MLTIRQTADNWAIELELAAPWQPYLFSKGFIAIDGISLTVGAVTAGRFWLHIIPETLADHHSGAASGRRLGQY